MKITLKFQCRRIQHCAFNRLFVIVLPCILLLSPPAESSPPQRPRIAPGGNNHVPSAENSVRALVTQDLSSGLTPTDLVTALLGPGVSVSNVVFTGANVAAGTFTGGAGIVGFDHGIILSSGSISFVPGPNTQDSTSGVNAGLGDADLTGLIPGYTTFDACALEFDFSCTGTQILQFQYVFTSEEYNEWVNTPFNDVFGFFLNGVNIALVPGSPGTPVSVNNVNCENPFNPPAGSYCNLYINNRCADIPPGAFPCAGVRDTEMDGLTVILTATATLQPGLNHIKLAIADAGDQVLDSNVFIQGQSFSCGAPTGACCDTAALTCTENILQANCQGPNLVWSVGLTCSQLNPPCTPVIHPDGTDCSNPIPIGALPFVDLNTTDNKGNDYTNTCLGQYDNGKDILYKLTITSTQCVDIIVTGDTANDNWIGVALDTVCPPGPTCLASATSPGTVATITNLTLTPGTYYLMIDRWPLASDNLQFTLSITSCGGAPTGACCDTNTHICTNQVLQVNCQSSHEVWSMGQTCNQLNPPCAPEVHPPGMDCEFPVYVTMIPFVDINTTSDKFEDYSNTCLGNYDNGDDIIYQITLTEAHCVDINVTGSTPADNFIGVAIDDTCPPGSSCIAFATTPGTVALISNLSLAPGTYYLMIDRRPQQGVNGLDFRLTITDCAPPAGVCCYPDGSCTVTAQVDCGGIWHGEWADCSVAQCPQPIGACCSHDGRCDQLTEAACLVGNGWAWFSGVPCTPNPCPYVMGDVNCDHAVNLDDIPEFVKALIGGYAGCDITLADMDFSGVADGGDIQLFVDTLLKL